jgi:transcriptional regulator with XRE-family HTH domain
VWHDRRVLGERIRERRKELNLTAKDFAQLAGVSPALISQIERGNTDPSLDSLRRIARALNVPLFDLFDERPRQHARVVRREQRMTLTAPDGGIAYERVSPGNGRLELLHGVLQPGTVSSPTLWAHPPSEECVVVVEGTVVVEIEDEEIVLGPGDSAYFDSARPHRYRNDTEAPARFLVAVTPPSF